MQLNPENFSEPGSSKHRGVYWHTKSRKWRTVIRHRKQNHQLGSFPTEEEAAAVAGEAHAARDRGELDTWLAERKRNKKGKVSDSMTLGITNSDTNIQFSHHCSRRCHLAVRKGKGAPKP